MSFRLPLFILTLAATLAACATVSTPPGEALRAAAQAITAAEQDRAVDYAGVELGEAHAKLAAAHDAVAHKQMAEAQRLADQARVDAELASARTALAKARLVDEEMRKSNQALQQEMSRNSGAQP